MREWLGVSNHDGDTVNVSHIGERIRNAWMTKVSRKIGTEE